MAPGRVNEFFFGDPKGEKLQWTPHGPFYRGPTWVYYGQLTVGHL